MEPYFNSEPAPHYNHWKRIGGFVLTTALTTGGVELITGFLFDHREALPEAIPIAFASNCLVVTASHWYYRIAKRKG